ncbi:protein max isoform X2 [Strongylocentrotus purpuratus]|uniref:Protein max n=1 Tax=Strongylocentrotus purpuratus TaxID=7668 RepID=A0A7M7RE00_STRPU|nr:protein max isoform X2 [Strongylocentrotus purpuratus]|eukprot:XP_792474.2 PREDICTED: protein max isoform X2 [Strongylocentrotus purpuratus]
MSDDDRDIDVESDDELNDGDLDNLTQAEKRAHHNALERKRRDHIKDSFSMLRDSVPNLQGEKASRAQILNKATDYIQFMRRKNNSHQTDIDDLKKQNSTLEQQIRLLERSSTGEVAKTNGIILNTKLSHYDAGSESDSNSSDNHPKPGHKSRKRLKGEHSGSSKSSKKKDDSR